MNPLQTFIIPCLLLGELPCLLITLLDNRPSTEQLYKVGSVYLRNTALILTVGQVGMECIVRTGMVPYDMSPTLPPLPILFVQYVAASLCTEFLFYWLHRFVHRCRPLYYMLHAHHHQWVHNSIAIVNHDLQLPELCIFALCPAIPCAVLGVHWTVMMFLAMFTNWQGTYGHSRLHHPVVDAVLLTDSRDHDNHHVHPTCNFSGGGWFSVMDRLFGTYRAAV